MKELDDFTVERLERLIAIAAALGCATLDGSEVAALARIALAAKTTKPVAITDKSEITGLTEPGWVGNFMEPNFKGVDKGDEVYLYTAPVLNSPVIPGNRKAFEECYSNAPNFTDNENWAWHFWKLSRESLVVELPQASDPADMFVSHVYDSSEVDKAIRAIGIRIKEEGI